MGSCALTKVPSGMEYAESFWPIAGDVDESLVVDNDAAVGGPEI